MNKKLYAIVVAGGQGSRMKSELPKQFIPLQKKPILFHTLQRFLEFPHPVEIILVLPEKEIQTWENISNNYNLNVKNVKIISGGASRFLSVKNGLASLPTSDGVVAIHDGVRPFLELSLLEKCYHVALEKGNAVAAVALKDSIRQVKEDGSSVSVNRNEYFLVQTPQVFNLSLIKNCYENAASDHFTDDASVAEQAGVGINIVQGSYENIKITTPEDLALAEAVLKNFRYQ